MRFVADADALGLAIGASTVVFGSSLQFRTNVHTHTHTYLKREEEEGLGFRV